MNPDEKRAIRWYTCYEEVEECSSLRQERNRRHPRLAELIGIR